MPALLSGSSLRAGSVNSFITLANAQPQLPATPTVSTGYTIITEVVYPSELVTKYASSLGNIQFTNGILQTNLSDLNINLVGNGTGTVIISGLVANTNSDTGVLVVKGGIGISEGIRTGKDIVVNDLTIGQGYSNRSGGVNNIVITGTATPQLNDFNVGQESIVIGYDALKNIDTSYKVIAIGRNALKTGKFLSNTIAIGDSALQKIGSTQTEFSGNITGIISVNTLTLELSGHTLVDGTEITIRNVGGMTELNDRIYYVDVISPTSIKLYSDINLQNGIDASTYNGYTSGTGEIFKTLLWNGNFGIGNNAGKNLINGEENFFLGYNPAVNFTTGSYNFFMGHEIASNMITGNANISIGGDNLVDGLDNQINIGSVIYYNGSGYLELNADTALGLGTESTSTVSGAFNVDGGVGITGNLYLGGELHVTTSTQSTTATNGALVVTGGVGIGGDLWVQGTINGTIVSSLSSLSSQEAEKIKANPTTSTNYYLALTSTQSGYTSIFSPLSVVYNGTTDVLSVAGAVNIGRSLNVENGITTQNGDIGIGIETLTGNEYFALHVNKFTGALEFHPNRVTATTSTTAVFVIDDDGGPTLSVNPFKVTNTSSSTNTTTGALQVSGGVGVAGSIYSRDGNPLQNYLLYTPKVTVTNTGLPPLNPRPGDFWIDATILAEFQFIQDGTDTFWIQITTL